MTRAVRRGRRQRGQGGQSLVEGVLVLALLLTIGGSAFTLAVRIVAQVEFESAVANAAASTLSAPRGADDLMQADAEDAFRGTLGAHGGLQAGSIHCTSRPADGGPAGSRLVTCRGEGLLHLDRLPLPVPVPLPLHAEATVLLPAFRQCLAPAADVAGCGA